MNCRTNPRTRGKSQHHWLGLGNECCDCCVGSCLDLLRKFDPATKRGLTYRELSFVISFKVIYFWIPG